MLKVIVFLVYYTYIFSTSFVLYYISMIQFFSEIHLVAAIHYAAFLAVSMIFYISGYIMFIDEMLKEKVYKKIT